MGSVLRALLLSSLALGSAAGAAAAGTGQGCSEGVCAAAGNGDDASLLHVRAQQSLNSTLGTGPVSGQCNQCSKAKNIAEAEFVNNCQENMVFQWGSKECVVPAKATCKIGVPGSCVGGGAARPTCSDIKTSRAGPESNRLSWYIEGDKTVANHIELTHPWNGLNSGISNPNMIDHNGFAMRSRLEFFLKGTETPYCGDYGMETVYPDDMIIKDAQGKYQCNKKYDLMDASRAPGCNPGQGFCACTDPVGFKHGFCQQAKQCNFVFEQSLLLISDKSGGYRCRTISDRNFQKSTPPFCGPPDKVPGGAAQTCRAPNQYYTDDVAKAKQAGSTRAFGQNWGLGILLNPSCCRKESAKMKLTMCNDRNQAADAKRCTCGSPAGDVDAALAACCFEG